jgi:hypothetical protein
MPITAERKQLLIEILKDLSSVELVRIAGAVYDSFVAADLPWEKMFTISNHMFAKVPWSRLPPTLGNTQVLLIRAVDEKLLKVMPELLDVYIDEPVAETAQPTFSPPPMETVAVNDAAVGTQSTISFSTTPPITPTTRSQIDELDEEASMHGMDTESAPEGGQAPEAEVRTDSADDDTSGVEEDEPVVTDEEEEDEISVSSSEANGHNDDAVVHHEDKVAVDSTVTTP